MRVLKGIKTLVETLSGCDVEWHGARTITLVDKRHRKDASFSSRAQLRSIIERAKIDLVLDVGANEGQFARGLRTFYAGEILSFEPVTSTFERLAAAAAADPKWHPQAFALGSRTSTQTINVLGETVFSSLLSTNGYGAQRFGERMKVSRTETIQVRRLDEVLDELVPDCRQRRIFLKMDTQGYDLEVFKGLGDKADLIVALLSEISLISIYEGSPHWTDSICTYEKAGFGVVGMFPVTKDGGRVIEYDCLLARTLQ